MPASGLLLGWGGIVLAVFFAFVILDGGPKDPVAYGALILPALFGWRGWAAIREHYRTHAEWEKRYGEDEG